MSLDQNAIQILGRKEQEGYEVSTWLLFAGGILPVGALVFVVSCLALCLLCKKRESMGATSNHIVLRKDKTLKDRLVEVAGDTAKLDDEFKQLHEVVDQEVRETTTHTHTAHDRYNDIREFSEHETRYDCPCVLLVPYDGKIITTKTAAGIYKQQLI